MSITLTVRNGTPVGRKSLCYTCRYASIQIGYAESEKEIRCGYFTESPRLVTFPVSECSDYLSKLVPTLYELEKIAFIIDVKTVNVRAGFASATVKATKSEEDND